MLNFVSKTLLGLFKEISDATGTDACEDLHEFGGRDAEEGHARLSGQTRAMLNEGGRAPCLENHRW